MKVSSSLRDRLIWSAAISFGVAISSTLVVPPFVSPAAASYCCLPRQSHCCLPGRSQVVFTPTQEVSEDYSLSLNYIDPGYVLTRVLVPIIYASLIIYIAGLIQRK